MINKWVVELSLLSFMANKTGLTNLTAWGGYVVQYWNYLWNCIKQSNRKFLNFSSIRNSAQYNPNMAGKHTNGKWLQHGVTHICCFYLNCDYKLCMVLVLDQDKVKVESILCLVD